jgi:hypothetical protein
MTERTEKYLSFCAAMKPIVSPEYLVTCVSANTVVDPTPFNSNKLWLERLKQEAANDAAEEVGDAEKTEFGLSRSDLGVRPKMPFHLRLPFADWSVILFASKGISKGISTILEAGGAGFIFKDPDPPAQVNGPAVADGNPIPAGETGVPSEPPPNWIDLHDLETVTHVLVEGATNPETGESQLPDRLPLCIRSNKRLLQEHRFFTLEFIHHCLCDDPSILNEDPQDPAWIQRLPATCRVSPGRTASAS